MTAETISMQAGHPSDFGNTMDSNSVPTSKDDSITMDNLPNSLPYKEEQGRGRRRNRDFENGDVGDDYSADGDAGQSGLSRKRRRSRKGLDKKFDCNLEGCGKSYSRAEHLYRHQLNHNPKQIYYCDFTDCRRSFVRQDLCARHKERHTARGSQLLRKDSMTHHLNPNVTAASMQNVGSNCNKVPNSPAINTQPAIGKPVGQLSGSVTTSSEMMPSDTSLTMDAVVNQSPTNASKGSNNDEAFYSNATQFGAPFNSLGNTRPQMSPHPSTGSVNMNHMTTNPSYPTSGSSQPYNSTLYSNSNRTRYQSPSIAGFRNQHSFPSFSSLPPPSYSTMTTTSPSKFADLNYGPTPALDVSAAPHKVIPDSGMINNSDITDNLNTTMILPMFGNDGFFPRAQAEDFNNWLFDPIASFSSGYGAPPNLPNNLLGSAPSGGLQGPNFKQELIDNLFLQMTPQQLSVNDMLDNSSPGFILTKEKRNILVDRITVRFNENDISGCKKDEILSGNQDDDNHVLSLKMMQTYLRCYWIHIHPQMPMLHRPTFNAATCPDILLLIIITLGASCFEKKCADHESAMRHMTLANFIAMHLRWEIFNDPEFQPPSKLWIFQASLLLELFEKMFSTRPMHERAHIHHATTLTLMRRGSSLTGRPAVETPPSVKDDVQGRTASDATGANSRSANLLDEWWKRWIINEATRRTSFVAFVMDSLHATIFGHSAIMVAHEMRLPLPCDESLWSGRSGAEVHRTEQALRQQGHRPTTFLDGLKKILHQQAVRTNSFGRSILMAGLLSVTWHMNQRDLQVSYLGVSQVLGGRDKWRSSLTSAFDFWNYDYERSGAKSMEMYASNSVVGLGNSQDDYNSESRTVLHHLAHMAMHVDIVDCQIFAGAKRLMGRVISLQDFQSAQERMKEKWAPTARARDATFHAIQFLSKTLIPEDHDLPVQEMSVLHYSIRQDFLICRPWVIYFAALIVWSYGYARDGPIQKTYRLSTFKDKVTDMQCFLRRLGRLNGPEYLETTDNRNACLGLLLILKDIFAESKWELLREASILLGKCVEMLESSR